MTKLLPIAILSSLLALSSIASDNKLCKHCSEICKKAMDMYKNETSQDTRVKLMKLIHHCDAVREKENCQCEYQRSNK